MLPVVGADVLGTFAQWRSPDRILALATLAILERGEDDASPRPQEEWVPVRTGGRQEDGTTTSGRARQLRTRRVDVSSTEIRARVRDGRPLTGFVPDAVATYISEHGLYR